MAGILNNKTRMLDTILTREGRRQIASGDLRIKYVTFTDRHTFYSQEDDDAADDADDRIFLEAFHRPQDQIIFETDNDGRFLPFEGSDIKISNGKLYKALGTSYQEITGNDTAESAGELLDSSTQNFIEQQIIGTKDVFSDSSEFSVYPDNVIFKITNDVPFSRNQMSKIDLTHVDSLFQDKRLQHLPFYKYLPPVNRPKAGSTSGEPLGYYARLNKDAPMTYGDIINMLYNKDYVELSYPSTSIENNIVAQIIEARPDNVQKLALIDCGEFYSESLKNSSSHVYFVGKVIVDANGLHTFVNMFTILFE